MKIFKIRVLLRMTWIFVCCLIVVSSNRLFGQQTISATPSISSGCPGQNVSYYLYSPWDVTSVSWTVIGSSSVSYPSNRQVNVIWATTGTVSVSFYTVDPQDPTGTYQYKTVSTSFSVTTPGTISISAGSILCQGNTMNLSASGGTNYVWTGSNIISGQETNQITIDPSTLGSHTYFVTAQEPKCGTNVSSSKIIEVKPKPTTPPQTSLVYCAFEKPKLQIEGSSLATNYRWYANGNILGEGHELEIDYLEGAGPFQYYSKALSTDGCESIDEASVTVSIESSCDDKLNWVETKSLDETGQIYANSKSYFNLLGQLMQSQTKVYSFGTPVVMASEPLQDHLNRQVGSTLIAPILESSFIYKHHFNRKSDKYLKYDYTDFDKDESEDKTLNPEPVGNITPGTLGWYYSENNTLEENVPVTGFPYSRAEFYRDGGGETRKVGAPGDELRLGKEHEPFSGSFPVYNELDDYLDKRRDIGLTDNIIGNSLINEGAQTVSRDANGIYTISIADKTGNPVMTARPATFDDYTLSVNNNIRVSLDLNAPYSFPFAYFYLTQPTPITIESSGAYSVENLVSDEIRYGQTFEDENGKWPAGFYRIKSSDLNLNVLVHYTTYYKDVSYIFYDNAGRMISSVSPNGFNQWQNGVSYQNIDKSTYTYNHQGWLMSTIEPDAGKSEFMYRQDGNIRFSQNAQQAFDNHFSYTHYDDFDRPVESGEYIGTYIFNSQQLKNQLEIDQQQLWAPADIRDWVKTHYDFPVSSIINLPSSYTQEFVRGSVSWTENENITTWYSYDELGRVTWMAQKPKLLNRTFVIEYQYDFLGNVLKVHSLAYVNGTALDEFYHHYQYDLDRRLSKVFTSTDGSNLKLRATYIYYLHGPLKRIELGEKLQGIDFVYNINGWLKQINHPDSQRDPGGDGGTDSEFKEDVFGMLFNYYESEFNGLLETSFLIPKAPTPNDSQDQNNFLNSIHNLISPVGIAHNNKDDESIRTPSYYSAHNDWFNKSLNQYFESQSMSLKGFTADEFNQRNISQEDYIASTDNSFPHTFDLVDRKSQVTSSSFILGPPIRSFFIDFGINPTNTTGWNNFGYASTGSTIPLVDGAGGSTTVTFEAVYLPGANLVNSTGYSGQLGTYPASACVDSHYIQGEGSTYRINGLDITKVYDVKIFASRMSVSNERKGIYKVNGQSLVLEAANNTNQSITFSRIVPDASGRIIIEVALNPGSSYAYINLMEVIEQQPSTLQAPSNISATASGTNVVIAWNDNTTTEDGFKVERKLNTATYFTEIGQVLSNETQYVDTGLNEGNSYDYRVRAFNTSDESNYSDTVRVFINPSVPGIIAGRRRFLIDFGTVQTNNPGWNNLGYSTQGNSLPLIDTKGNSTAVTLLAVVYPKANPVEYGGYQGQVLDYPPSACSDNHYTEGNSGNTYRLIGLDQTKVYDVRIFASRLNATNERVGIYIVNGQQQTFEAWNNTSETILFPGIAPDASGHITIELFRDPSSVYAYLNVLDMVEKTVMQTPTNIEATLVNTSVQLNWTDNTAGEDGYVIERRLSGEVQFSEIARVSENVATFTDINPLANDYEYRVFAYTSYNQSQYSSTAIISVPDITPLEATGLTLTQVGNNVSLTWTDNATNEAGYRIERKLSAELDFTVIGLAGVNTEEFLDIHPPLGNTYQYRVVAYSTLGEFAESNTVSIQIDLPPNQSTISRRFLIDFGGILTEQVGWNNLDYCRPGKTISLVEADGGSSSVSLKVERIPSANPMYVFGYNGQVEGYPATAVADSHFAYESGNIYRLMGLDKSKTYDLKIYGSYVTEAGLPYTGEYSVNSQALTLDPTADEGMGNSILFNDAVTDASGSISIYIKPIGNSTATYISVLEVEEKVNSIPLVESPTDLLANRNGKSITVDWNDVENIIGYKVERKSSKDVIFRTIGQVDASNSQFLDTQVEWNETYEYRIYAFSDLGRSPYSMEYSVSAITPINKESLIDWTALEGVVIDEENNLTKKGSTGFGNGGGISVDKLSPITDGWVEMQADEINTTRMIGFSPSNNGAGMMIDYAIMFNEDGNIYVWEDGIQIIQLGSYTTGTVVKVGRIGSDMHYYVNGTLKYTSGKPSSGELLVDAAIKNLGGTIKGVRLSFATPAPKYAAANLSGSNVTLTWGDKGSNELGFTVKRRIVGTTSFTEVAQLGANTVQYVDQLPDSQQYEYQILSNYSGGIGMSNIILAYSQGLVPDIIEFNALKYFYMNTMGDQWTTRTNWPTGNEWSTSPTDFSTFNTWSGVTVNNKDVTSLSFRSNNLTGSFPESLLDLTALRAFDFAYNNLTGSLTPEISRWTSLSTLNLYNNKMSGEIPVEFCDLTALTAANVGRNYFTGQIPANIGNLANLYFFAFYGNQFSGNIPESLYSLTKLTELYLYENNFSGGISESIGNLNKLKIFRVYRSGLEGQLPNSLGNIGTLQELYMENNEFTGSYPSNWANLTNLKWLRAFYTKLSGDIPSWIGSLSKLESLSIGTSNLTGSIPTSIAQLTNLTGLYLERSDLSGTTIPDELNSLNKLQYVDLKFDNLDGPIPAWLMNKPTIKTYRLNDNNFTQLPDFSSRTDKADLTINIENNQIPFEDIERYFTGPGSHPFKYFVYRSQRLAEPPLTTQTVINTELRMEAPSGGAHGVYQWEKWDGNAWVDISGINESSDPRIFLIASVDDIHAGKYRFKVTNDWATGLEFESGEIEVFVDDPSRLEQVKPLYNGMITATSWRTDEVFESENPEFKGIYFYDYDEKYQIKEATFAEPDFTTDTYTVAGNKFRVTNLNYDPNGNIESLKRYNEAALQIHNFTYDYENQGQTTGAQQNNKLKSVSGYVNAYTYNKIGQMISAVKETGDNQYVEYDVSGKVTSVYSDATHSTLVLRNLYDDRGFRLAKVSYPTGGGDPRTTWYIRDAAGNVVSIYEQEGSPSITNADKITQTEIPIYGSGKIGTYYPAQDGSVNYEITDHLGNVRALVRENINLYTATMEDNNQEELSNPRVAEMQYFENLFETEVVDARMNYSAAVPGVVDSPEKAAYLFWQDGMQGLEATDKSVGPSIALKVAAGDKLDLETWARFERKLTYEGLDLTAIASLLGGTFADIQGFEGYSIPETSQNLLGVLQGAGYPDEDEGALPFAFLNYIVYDKNMNQQDAGWVQVSEAAGFDPGGEGIPNNHQHEHLKFEGPINIVQDGFIYIWVSNQSENTKVWFDDLRVRHEQTIITQATDYGVWGDVIREEKSDESVYRFGYQGQYAEKDEETGWNHFETRNYNPVIGRWLSIDPANQFTSPYNGMGNNLVNGVDPDGEFTIYVNRVTGEEVEVNDGIDRTLYVNVVDFETAQAYSVLIDGSGFYDTDFVEGYQEFYNSQISYDGFTFSALWDMYWNQPTNIFAGGQLQNNVQGGMSEGIMWMTPGGAGFSAFKGFRNALSVKGGQSLVGRALQKHPNIATLVGVTTKLTTNAARGSVGQEALKYIMRNGERIVKSHKTFGKVVDYKLANGLGARFNAVTNEFIGFLGRGL